jgi:hypothetical protein
MLKLVFGTVTEDADVNECVPPAIIRVPDPDPVNDPVCVAPTASDRVPLVMFTVPSLVRAVLPDPNVAVIAAAPVRLTVAPDWFAKAAAKD